VNFNELLYRPVKCLFHRIRKETGRQFVIGAVKGQALATIALLVAARIGTIAFCQIGLVIGTLYFHKDYNTFINYAGQGISTADVPRKPLYYKESKRPGIYPAFMASLYTFIHILYLICSRHRIIRF